MDWAELCSDLLRLISKRLGELSNFVRFRAVCKPWRSHVLPSNHPPQLPWFIETNPETSDVKFFSLYSNKIHTLHIPQAKGTEILGPSKEYVFIKNSCDSPESFLINPLTKSCFTISNREIPQEEIYCMQIYPIYIGPSKNPNPNSNGYENGVTVVLHAEVENDMEENFSHIPNVILWRSDHDMINFFDVPSPQAYHKGRLFLSDVITTIIDVTTRNEVVISNNGINFNYLIEASGYLLGVVNLSTYPTTQRSFEVYQLIHDGGTNPEWVKLENCIGNRMLFLGIYSRFCVEAGDIDGIKGNCIYFTWSNDFGEFGDERGDILGMYDLENKQTQVLPTPGEFHGTWFAPSLW